MWSMDAYSKAWLLLWTAALNPSLKEEDLLLRSEWWRWRRLPLGTEFISHRSTMPMDRWITDFRQEQVQGARSARHRSIKNQNQPKFSRRRNKLNRQDNRSLGLADTRQHVSSILLHGRQPDFDVHLHRAAQDSSGAGTALALAAAIWYLHSVSLCQIQQRAPRGTLTNLFRVRNTTVSTGRAPGGQGPSDI